MQVYAVLYVADGDMKGNFLIAVKRRKGYFFGNRATGTGRLRPEGRQLNGAGLFALPGGGREGGEPIAVGAAREFWEETNVEVPPGPQPRTHTFTDGTGPEPRDYAAAYFPVDATALQAIRDVVEDTNLPAGDRAAEAVRAGTIRTYAGIFVRYPNAPSSNELAGADVWNIPLTWPTIQAWEHNPMLDWYFFILRYLKNQILHV